MMGTMFVVLDGVDGCGKTTQAERLTATLRASGRQALHVREPGSTQVGERVRALLLDPELSMSPEVETLLFAAARRQMLDEIVAPALAAGQVVVCERFHPSTFAYQAIAGDLKPERVMDLLLGWATAPAPDLVLLLELDVAEATRRRGAATDRIEAKGAAYMQRVAAGYGDYARRASERGDASVRVIPAAGAADEVASAVWHVVEPCLR